MNYIAKTVEDFFVKLNQMQLELSAFSQDLDNRSEKIPAYLKEFENTIFNNTGKMNLSETNAVDKAAKKTLDTLHTAIELWRKKIEQDRKGQEFIRKNEKYLVIMIFGAVKTGKSSLGNFFAGKDFLEAPFDNKYKHIERPVFETEERGRNTGDVERDSLGNTWFSEGVIDTTGAIQYFTISGLRWVDSPGTGAVEKDGDSKNMNDLVKEYLPYTDLCIFLMNSSEPGLQEDMRYIQELNEKEQEALLVITRSDISEPDIDESGNFISMVIPKSPERRKLQEDDACIRLKKSYPDIDAEKFRAISISTLLAKQAIADDDEEKYKSSNLDKLMSIIGDKVSENVIARKRANPQRLLNDYIGQVWASVDLIIEDIKLMQREIDHYKNGIDEKADIIVSNVKQGVRTEIMELSYDWNSQVKSGGSVDGKEVNKSISEIVESKVNQEINKQMARIIEDYSNKELMSVSANLSVGTLKKKTKTVKHTYTETYTVSRAPDGIIEHVRHFFGKEYKTLRTEERTEEQVIDVGTNIDEFLGDLMPKVEQFSREQAQNSLKVLETNYFKVQERFIAQVIHESETLKEKLNKLKFGA